MILQAETIEYHRLPIAGRQNGADIDPTAYPVFLGLAPAGEKPAAWEGASWETEGTIYYAGAVFGTGELGWDGAGDFDAFVRLDPPGVENVIRKIERVRVQ